MAEPTMKMLIDKYHEDAGFLSEPPEPLYVIGYDVQKTIQNGEAVYRLWQVMAEITDMASLFDLSSIPFHKFLTQFAYKFDEATSTLINVPERNADDNNYISIGLSELHEMGIELSSVVVAAHWLIEEYLEENEITREQLKHQVDASLRDLL
jgi:hypothetical protein